MKLCRRRVARSLDGPGPDMIHSANASCCATLLRCRRHGQYVHSLHGVELYACERHLPRQSRPCLSAEEIAELAATKWNYNPDVIRSLAQQNADTVMGLLFLLFAFALELSAGRRAHHDNGELRRRAGAAAVICVAIVSVCAFIIAKGVARRKGATATHVIEEMLRAQSGVPPPSAQ